MPSEQEMVMDSFAYIFVLPIVAVILDSIIGDPHSFPHPVRYIGKGLDFYESAVRKIGLNLRFAGYAAVFLFCLIVWKLVSFLTSVPVIGFFLAVYFGYAGLALGCLMDETQKVADILNVGDMEGARKAVSMLVSRDTNELSEQEIRRTLAETLSENLNDGFVAPLFYLVLFGPAGMWVYKTVSTMDSMWGYKTARYGKLGYAAAKLDDTLAFVPARLTAKIMIWIGKERGLDSISAKENVAKDAAKMESPNAGWPMAAAAWLVGGQMGGETVYFGKIKQKPVLGPVGKVWDSQMISTLIHTCRRTGHATAVIFILAGGILKVIF